MKNKSETVSRRLTGWLLDTEKITALVTNAAEAATVTLDHLLNWSSLTRLNRHMIRKSNIIPERSLLPAPALPPLTPTH